MLLREYGILKKEYEELYRTHDHSQIDDNHFQENILNKQREIENENQKIRLLFERLEQNQEKIKQIFLEIMTFSENIIKNQNILKELENDDMKKYLEEVVTIFQVRFIARILPKKMKVEYDTLTEAITQNKELINNLNKTIEEYEQNSKEMQKEYVDAITSKYDAEIRLLALEKLNEILDRDNWATNAYKKLDSFIDLDSPNRNFDIKDFLCDFLKPLDIVNLEDNELDFNKYEGTSSVTTFYRQSVQVYGMVKAIYNPEILKCDNILEICQGVLERSGCNSKIRDFDLQLGGSEFWNKTAGNYIGRLLEKKRKRLTDEGLSEINIHNQLEIIKAKLDSEEISDLEKDNILFSLDSTCEDDNLLIKNSIEFEMAKLQKFYDVFLKDAIVDLKDKKSIRKYIEDCVILKELFVQIHPFTDKNGRTSRALFNVLLMKKGIKPIVPYRDYASREEDHSVAEMFSRGMHDKLFEYYLRKIPEYNDDEFSYLSKQNENMEI